MYLREATHRLLQELDQPVITEYEFFVRTKNLLIEGSFHGEAIRRQPLDWDLYRCRSLLRKLMRDRVLVPDNDFKAGAWRLIESSVVGTAEEVCCLVDPFCYVSHLSAMHFHGLVSQEPAEVQFTTPDRAAWKAQRDEKMRMDLGDLAMSPDLPLLVHIGFKPKVRRREVKLYETKSSSPTVQGRHSRVRVEKVGYVFLGMLTAPSLSGGIQHVLDVWRTHGFNFREQIIPAVDSSTSKIVRVRAGYILEEMLGLSDSRIDRWLKDAQRGGSRKLDPDAPYAPVFSEKWMLSINI